MLDDQTYREWTTVFMPGSYVVGNWKKNSKMQFLAPDENGKLSGMTSIIAENKPNEYLSIHHLGIVKDGIEDTTSEAVKKWNGFENYTFRGDGDQTELVIDMDVNDEYKEYFDTTWPAALQKLKELAEK